MCCLSIAMIMAFSGSILSDDFCQAFRRMGNRISYVYKHGLKPGKYEISTFQVIVDRMYWDFLFNLTTHLTTFYDRESYSAPFFTDDNILGPHVYGEEGTKKSAILYCSPKERQSEKWWSLESLTITTETWSTWMSLQNLKSGLSVVFLSRSTPLFTTAVFTTTEWTSLSAQHPVNNFLDCTINSKNKMERKALLQLKHRTKPQLRLKTWIWIWKWSVFGLNGVIERTLSDTLCSWVPIKPDFSGVGNISLITRLVRLWSQLLIV